MIAIEGHDARAFTRNGHDWTDKYRPIVNGARGFARSAILDGEMVVQDAHGRSDFGALRSAITHHPDRLILYAFDLLALNSRDLRARTLMERRADLSELLGEPDPACPIQFSAHVVGNGAAMFEAADAMGLEGIVSKKLGSRYRSGRSLSWLKVKCFAEAEFLVIGTEQGVGPTTALLARETDDGLEYAAGNAPVTNVRNLTSPFWRNALANPERRCLVPATEFCEWEGEKGSKVKRWFSVSASPVFAFAGIWRPIGPQAEAGRAFAFLTCEPNPLVAPIHPKAMPVILQPEDYEGWLDGTYSEVCALAAPFPSQLMQVV